MQACDHYGVSPVLERVDGLDSARSCVPQHSSATVRSPGPSDPRPQLKALDDEVDDLVLVGLLIVVVFNNAEWIHHDRQEHVDEDKWHHEHEAEEKQRTEDAVGITHLKEGRPAQHKTQQGRQRSHDASVTGEDGAEYKWRDQGKSGEDNSPYNTEHQQRIVSVLQGGRKKREALVKSKQLVQFNVRQEHYDSQNECVGLVPVTCELKTLEIERIVFHQVQDIPES